MNLPTILVAAALLAANPPAPSAPAAPLHCSELVRLEVATHLLRGTLSRMGGDAPNEKGNVVCSFVRTDGTPGAVSLAMGPEDLWPKAFAGYKDKKRIIKQDDVAALGKDGTYFRAALTEPKKGWNGLTIYGVKAGGKGRHYLLNMQIDGGDEALVREYLVETMKKVIEKGP